MAIGKTVRLFLAEGTPGGLVTAEIMNWTGQVVTGPRSHLANLLARPEVKKTGVYVLLGDDPNGVDNLRIYVGESDDVSVRLKDHEAKRQFWDRVVVLTSKDENLTKAHVRYLESRLITIAHRAKRSSVENGTAPAPPRLPEADVSDMEYYLSQVQIVLPVLSINAFRQAVSVVTPGAATHPVSPAFEAGLGGQARASAEEIDGEFTVLKGSRATPWKGTTTSYKALQDRLVTDGTLHLDPASGDLIFTRDKVFASPSAASAIVLGRNSNGRIEWRIKGERRNYGEWQDQQLSSGPGVPS